jgi:hypothetical protein
MSRSGIGPAGKGLRLYPSVYACEQSDRPIVPERPSKKVLQSREWGREAAEMLEGRDLTEGNSLLIW